jgi:hypothetical protein
MLIFFISLYELGPLACSNSESISRLLNRIGEWKDSLDGG